MPKNIYQCKNCSSKLSGYQKKFCSRSCSATYNNKQRKPRTLENRIQTSTSVKKFLKENPEKITRLYKEKHPRYKPELHIIIPHICKYETCNILITKNKNKYCSSKCRNKANSEFRSEWLKNNRSHIVGRAEPSWI